MRTASHFAQEAAPTTAGLLHSLASTLPAQAPLARRAHALADRLAQGACNRALQHRAADLLAALLDVADESGFADPDLLDEEFDL